MPLRCERERLDSSRERAGRERNPLGGAFRRTSRTTYIYPDACHDPVERWYLPLDPGRTPTLRLHLRRSGGEPRPQPRPVDETAFGLHGLAGRRVRKSIGRFRAGGTFYEL